MDEIEEIDKITAILIELNIYKDLRLEILRYYYKLKNKRRFILLYINGYQDGYHEIIPEIPIDQIDLINFYRYIEQNSYNNDFDYEIYEYNKNKITIGTYHSRYYPTYTVFETEDFIKVLKKEIGFDSLNFPLNYLLNKPGDDLRPAIKYVEL